MGSARSILLAMLMIPGPMSIGQSVASLHSLVIASRGDGKVIVPVNEGDLSDVHFSLVEVLGVRPKTQVTLSASAASGEPLLSRFSSVYAAADSSDLLIAVCVAGWVPDPQRRGFFSIAGLHPDTVSAEYVLNFLEFMPTHNGVLFLISPSRADYPHEILRTTGTMGGGGKYVVVVRTQERTTFENLVESFLDALEEATGGANSDVNRDSFLSFSEWLQELSTICSASKLGLVPYKITDAVDFRIRQLK